MLIEVLRLVANVIFPAVAGYVVTLHLVLPLGMGWFPAFRPEAVMVVVVTGLVAASLCALSFAVQRVLARRATG